MQKNLTLQGKGSYLRVYKKGRKLYRNQLQKFLSDLFSYLGLDFKENYFINGIEADFLINGRLLFCRKLEKNEIEIVRKSGLPFTCIGRPGISGDKHEFLSLGNEEQKTVSLFMDDQSFNFDYAHILPMTKKCSVMHGHTSSLLVEITGRPVEGMVIDFGDAKDIIKNILKEVDHKLFINKKYVLSENGKEVRLSFSTIHGDFNIEAPKGTTVLMEGEATTENLAKYLVERIASEMPENVTSVGVYVYEGMNKGAYILAKIHEKEV
jgi:6-pyruvoyltetrahydropterin/6-carboxytetrahydropterin synthase